MLRITAIILASCLVTSGSAPAATPFSEALPVLYEEIELHASDGERDDWFGNPVALDGDRFVVGAVRDDDGAVHAGAAYVFERSPEGVWIETAKLTASDAEAEAWFGTVAVSSDTIVVGAEFDDEFGTGSGVAYVFELDGGGEWLETAKLVASDGGVWDSFGHSVAIHGSTIVVGARDHDTPAGENAGGAWVFERTEEGKWVEASKLTASDAGEADRFGEAVAVDRDLIVVGAHGVDETTGAVYVFGRDETGPWIEISRLRASDGAAADGFGASIALSGDRIAVGAVGRDDQGIESGAAYVFESDGAGGWVETAKLLSPDARNYDSFGSVGLDGDLLVVGAPGGNPMPGVNSGAADLFRREGGAWTHVSRLLPSDGRDQDQFGLRTAVDGDTVVIGARLDDFWGPDSGGVYVFELEECRLELQLEATAVRAGEDLRVGILLEHNRPETVTVPFRVWIEDADGGVVASRTTEPQTFHHGDTVRRELTLRIPEGTPRGEYRVFVGAERMQQGLAGAERSFQVLRPAPPTLVPPSR